MTFPLASAARCDTRRTPDVFRLSGPTCALDPRIHAYRNDLADVALAGIRFAPHYAQAEPRRCVTPSTMVLASPNEDSPAVSQLVHGEGFGLLDRSGGWAWGRCAHDGYVGYVRADALGPEETPAWRVVVPLALAFASASIKAPVIARYPIGSRLSGTATGEFVRTPGGFIHHRHLVRIEEDASDWVAIAERLVGLPYLWGGRGAGGIDCSGLVQVALGFAGLSVPRDSDQQRDALGRMMAADEPHARGDLVFMPGHVGIMLDAERLLHANAWWMAVAVEPLADVVARLEPQHARPILARRRIGP